MKIIYLTDIHGAFNRVASLLYETIADIYIVSGDLIDIPFYSIDSAIHYHDLQSNFNGMRRTQGQEEMVLEDFVDMLMEQPDTTDEIQELGSKYQQYTIRARRVMQQKYKVLENIFLTKSHGEIFTIPGNYDMDLKFTSLHERSLHLRWHDVGGLKISGYGGADVWTAGIPERYIIKYNAGIGVDDKKNEMSIFFNAIKPDVIVAHQPAHGVLDRHIARGPSGSPALRNFCDNNPVKLCLTGHMHNSWGFEYVENTVYLNPSHFGDITSTMPDVSEGGFFFEVEMEENVPMEISFKKFANNRVHDIADYTRNSNVWNEEIIDRERYNALKRDENFDLKIKKYTHIPEIELFKDIKQFFRMFQTRETEDRVRDLESTIKLVKGKFKDIALDVVGSVNLGISQKSSDIDVVLYIRCGHECDENMEMCDQYKRAKKIVSDSLSGKYNFEIIDCIDLGVVEESISMQNYECETTQRFVAYRSICRPINYKVIAPVEDLLNRDIKFREEMEGSIRSYFRIFVTTTKHIESFDKYEARLKTIGIKIPPYIKRKIREYLQKK